MTAGQPPLNPESHNLNTLLRQAGLAPVEAAVESKFDNYLALLLRWNARMNLTAVRDPADIVRRHFIESIACAQLLPESIHSLLDFGSGAGFPGIPIALCRPAITITLAESQAKKAAFLQEAIRTLGLNCHIWPRRAEELDRHFDAVALRAVDRMDRAVAASARLVRPGGHIAVLTTQSDLSNIKTSAGPDFHWPESFPLPGSEQRLLATASRLAPPPQP